MEKKSILEGISEHESVVVFNPTTELFVGKVGQSITVPSKPQVDPIGHTEADTYLKQLAHQPANTGHVSRAHVQQTVEIPAGHQLRVPGDVAQVIVRQLVKEMMQREGKTKVMANADIFMEYERRVVIDHQNMLDKVTTETVEERFNRRMEELNPEELTQDEETAFPDARRSTEPTDGGDASTAKTRGRPKRNPVANPS